MSRGPDAAWGTVLVPASPGAARAAPWPGGRTRRSRPEPSLLAELTRRDPSVARRAPVPVPASAARGCPPPHRLRDAGRGGGAAGRGRRAGHVSGVSQRFPDLSGTSAPVCRRICRPGMLFPAGCGVRRPPMARRIASMAGPHTITWDAKNRTITDLKWSHVWPGAGGRAPRIRPPATPAAGPPESAPRGRCCKTCCQARGAPPEDAAEGPASGADAPVRRPCGYGRAGGSWATKLTAGGGGPIRR